MDRFEMLKKYKELLDMGIITQEEFDEKKAMLLNNASENNPSLNNSGMVYANESAPISTTDNTDKTKDSKDAANILSVGNSGQIDTAAPIGEAEQQVNEGVRNNRNSKIPKLALIGIAALLVVALVIIVFPKNDAKEIQGSWEMVVITTDGQSSYPTGPIGGSLEVKGDKWTMEIHSLTQDSSWSGKVELDSKETTTDGTEGFIYNFMHEDEGSLKAVYVPNNNLLTVSTHNYMDVDNCATFKKKN